MKARVAGALAWSAAGALCALAAVDVARGPWDHDGGLYLMRSAYVAEGFRPYFDYLSFYPPATEILTAPIIATGIDRFALAIAIPLLWNALNAAAAALLARALGATPAGQALAASGFLILSIENGGNHLTLEHPVVFFTSLAFALVLSPPAFTPPRAFACGAFVAAAGLSKQNAVVLLIVVVAALIERRSEFDRRTVAALGAGLTTPLFALLAWLSFDLARFAHHVVGLLFAYGEASSGGMASFMAELNRSAPTAIALVGVPLAGIAAVAAGPRRAIAASALCGAAIQFAPRLLRDYPHYTLNVYPYVVVVLALAASSRGERVASSARLATAAAVGASVFALVLPNSLSRWSEPGVLGAAFAPVAAEVERLTSPGDRIRQYGAEPVIEYLASRLPEDLSIPPSTFGRWDGSHVAQETLPDRGPVVLVDRGQAWMPELEARLANEGFRRTVHAGAPDGFRMARGDIRKPVVSVWAR